MAFTALLCTTQGAYDTVTHATLDGCKRAAAERIHPWAHTRYASIQYQDEQGRLVQLVTSTSRLGRITWKPVRY